MNEAQASEAQLRQGGTCDPGQGQRAKVEGINIDRVCPPLMRDTVQSPFLELYTSSTSLARNTEKQTRKCVFFTIAQLDAGKM